MFFVTSPKKFTSTYSKGRPAQTAIERMLGIDDPQLADIFTVQTEKRLMLLAIIRPPATPPATSLAESRASSV
jgi:hypothetical protein